MTATEAAAPRIPAAARRLMVVNRNAAPAGHSGAMSPETLAADRVSQLLAGLDVPGPRYTCYPTADCYTERFGPADYRRALAARAAAGADAAPLSLDVLIPFGASVGHDACNKVGARRHEQVRPYLQALQREIDLHVAVLGRGQPVAQLHLGGGSPTFLSDAELGGLLASLRAAFRFAPAAELSIEVDPRTVDAARLRHLAALGFGRLSLRVLDLDPEVQRALRRDAPFEQLRALLTEARALGFASVNVDLVYGLPKQTPAAFARTVAQVGALRPDRIALHAYAQLPPHCKPARRVHAHELPGPGDRVHMLRTAISGFQALGYACIGMDHFALPDDPLARARREGRLQRSLHGYGVRPEGDRIGLGVAAIGQVGGACAQNAKTRAGYETALARGAFATERGLEPDADDRLRRDVIMALMCQGHADLAALSRQHGLEGGGGFRAELERLRVHESQGLVSLGPETVTLTPLGWYFVRTVAMVFDRHLQAAARREHDPRAV